MQRPNWRLWLAVAIGVLLATPPATAQQFAQKKGAQTRIISPAGLGPDYSGVVGSGVGLAPYTAEFGIKAGDFVIQPRLFLEGAYTTNFYREDSRSSVFGNTTELTDVFMLRLRPGLGIHNPGFSKVALSAGLDANLRVPLTGEARETDQIDVGGLAFLAISILPKGPFTLVLDEEFKRDLWTRPASYLANANRNQNRLGGGISVKPGGGALQFDLGYRWNIQRYDDANQLDRDGHDLKFLASWRFYPLNYFFIESTFNMVAYPNRPAEADGVVGNYQAGMPVKAYLGLSGYFSPKFALLVRLGYGNSILDQEAVATDDFSSFIGLLQLSFRFTSSTVLHIGGARDFSLVPFGGHRSYARAYLSFEQRLGRYGLLHIDGSFDYREYGTWKPYPTEITGGGSVTATVSDENRSDSRLRAGVMIDLNLHRAFGMTLGYRLEMVLSDFNLKAQAPGYNVETFAGYDEHRVYMTFNLRY